jgi:ABC-2 type transport system permease protein
MNGTLALARAEIARVRRNRRYMIFTVGLPVVLYLIWAKNVGKNTTVYGISFAAEYMVAMATFGAFSSAFNSNAIRISQERKDGWIRQLRLTTLPSQAYVVAKVIASMAISVPSITIMMLLGRFYGNVSLPMWEWLVVAIAIWFGTVIFAALAVAVGYRVDPNSAQPVAMVVFMLFTLLGGIWFPLTGGLAKFARLTPTYDVVHITTNVIQNGTVIWGYVAGVLVWMLIFAGLATLAVRATAETV